MRYAVVVGALLPAWAWLRPAWPGPAARAHLLRQGLLMQFGYFACTNLAIGHGMSPAGLALVIALQPICVACLSARVTGDAVPRGAWAGLALAFCGVALVVISGSAVAARDWLGLVFSGLALVAMTASALMERRAGQPCHPVLSNLILYAVGLAASLPLAAVLETMEVRWETPLILGLAYLVIANSLIATTLLLAMLRTGEAARVSSLFFLVPPLAALIAWVVLGREMAPLAWVGTALAAAGVMLARRN